MYEYTICYSTNFEKNKVKFDELWMVRTVGTVNPHMFVITNTPSTAASLNV